MDRTKKSETRQLYNMKGEIKMTETNNIKDILQSGMIISNYKKMCKLLNEEELQGDSKISQIKEWKRCFDFDREGQKYIINEIYDEPLSKDDKRVVGNNNEYAKFIELLLLNYLSKQKGYTAILTTKQLLSLLGMVNQNYLDKDHKKLENDDITIFDVNHFYQRSYKRLCEILFTTLNNLQNRKLATYSKLTMITQTMASGIQETREATDEEIKDIQKVEREVLVNMGYDNISKIFLSFQQDRYYNRVQELLIERYDIDKVYNLLKIIFHQPHIIKALEEAELETNKIMLNDKIIYAIDKQADNNFEKNTKQFNEYIDILEDNSLWGKRIADKKPFKFSDIYLFAQKKLSQYLLKYKNLNSYNRKRK